MDSSQVSSWGSLLNKLRNEMGYEAPKGKNTKKSNIEFVSLGIISMDLNSRFPLDVAVFSISLYQQQTNFHLFL